MSLRLRATVATAGHSRDGRAPGLLLPWLPPWRDCAQARPAWVTNPWARAMLGELGDNRVERREVGRVTAARRMDGHDLPQDRHALRKASLIYLERQPA
jgi:hypothetical protein